MNPVTSSCFFVYMKNILLSDIPIKILSTIVVLIKMMIIAYIALVNPKIKAPTDTITVFTANDALPVDI